MKLGMRFLFSILLLAGIVHSQNPAPAQLAVGDIQVEATGYGVTKTEATTQAKRDALAKGIGQILVSQTEIENFMLKRDQIITKTLGNIKSFQVLKEAQGPDGAWEVTVRALVSKGGIEKDLAALMLLKQAIGNPRIAMLIQETNMQDGGAVANKAETDLIDFFRSRDFEVVDPSAALRFRESPDGIKALAGDPEAAARIGSELNAEVMIIGSVVAKESDVTALKAFANSGMKSASATVSFKAVKVATRQILAAKSVDEPAVHVNVTTAGNNAISKAVKSLMEGRGAFFKTLVDAWSSEAKDGAVFQVRVVGVDSFGTAKSVKAALEKIGSKAEQRGFSKPELKVDLTYAGTADDLCERLDGAKVDAIGKLSVESYQGNSISLSLKR